MTTREPRDPHTTPAPPAHEATPNDRQYNSPASPRDGPGDGPALSIRDVPNARRYEARLGAALVGWVDYGRVGSRLVAVHTEVLKEYGGRGIGTALVRHVLADARANAFKVTPRCPLFAAHFERHPEDADVLAPGPQRG